LGGYLDHCLPLGFVGLVRFVGLVGLVGLVWVVGLVGLVARRLVARGLGCWARHAFSSVRAVALLV